MTELLTTSQVQEMLKVDRTTIYRMVESGRLPGIRVGKQWRFQHAEIAQWLKSHNTQPSAAGSPQAANGALVTASSQDASPALSLRETLPLACVQLIQDAFADMLGVMMIVTDIHGQPITQPSNSCGFYKTLMRHANLATICAGSWQQLAAEAALEPRFFGNEFGLLCARGLIHVEHIMAGMVIMGGIAPETWPPSATQIEQLAANLHIDPAELAQAVPHVHHLDKRDQDKALRSVQQIADIFSHIARDRSALCGKLQAIASLTVL